MVKAIELVKNPKFWIVISVIVVILIGAVAAIVLLIPSGEDVPPDGNGDGNGDGNSDGGSSDIYEWACSQWGDLEGNVESGYC